MSNTLFHSRSQDNSIIIDVIAQSTLYPHAVPPPPVMLRTLCDTDAAIRPSVCPSVCLSIPCHYVKNSVFRHIVTMEHQQEINSMLKVEPIGQRSPMTTGSTRKDLHLKIFCRQYLHNEDRQLWLLLNTNAKS